MADIGTIIGQVLQRAPNPLHSSAENESLAADVASIASFFSLASLLKETFKIVLLLGVVLYFFQLPMTLFLPLCACLLPHVIIAGVLRYRAAKLLPALVKRDAASFKSFLVARTRYSLLEDISRFFFGVLIVYVFSLFAPELFRTSATMRGFSFAVPVALIASVIAAYALCVLLLRLLFFIGYKRMDESNGYAKLRAVADVLYQKRTLAEGLPFLLAVVLIIGGVCWSYRIWQGFFFAVFFFVVLVFMVVLRLRHWRMIADTDLSPAGVVTHIETRRVNAAPIVGEKSLLSLLGIMYVTNGKLSFATSLNLAGPRTVVHPENALIVTTHRLLFVLLPVETGALQASSLMPNETVMWNRDAIRAAGASVLGSNVLAGARNNCVLELRYDAIESVALNKMQLDILANGETSSYLFFDKEYRDTLIPALRGALGKKFSVIV